MTVRNKSWLDQHVLEWDPAEFWADLVDTFAINALLTAGATAYYVNSGDSSASDSNPGTDPAEPLATLDGAFGVSGLTAGDLILLMPGHSETKSVTGSLFAADVAGVRVVGLGAGASRPTFTFGHTGAATTISGAGITMENILFVAGVDSITAPVTISAADVTLRGCEFRDTTDIEAVRWILTTAAADRLKVERCFHNGYTGGNACVNFARLVGVDGAEFRGNVYQGNYSTAIIEFHTTACTKFVSLGDVFNDTGTTDLSDNIVDSVGGAPSTWYVDGMDLAYGGSFSGGSGGAVAGDDVGAVSSAVSTVDSKVESVATVAGNTSTGVSTVNSIATTTSGGVSTADSKVESVATVAGNTSTGVSTVNSIATTTSGGVSTNSSIVTTVSAGVSTNTSRVTAVSTQLSEIYSILASGW